MDYEELFNAMRLVIRAEVKEAVGASEQRLRSAIREETNSAIYASEQRLGERLDKIEVRLDKIEVRLERLEKDVKELRLDVALLKTEFGEMKLTMDMYSQVTNDIRTSQFAVEERVDTQLKQVSTFNLSTLDTAKRFASSLKDLRRNMDEMYEIHEQHLRSMDESNAELLRMVNELEELASHIGARLSRHMNKPSNQAHPDSDSTAA